MDDPQPRHCLHLGVPIGLSTGSLSRVSQDVGPRIGRAAHGDDRIRRPVASIGWGSPLERAFGISFAVPAVAAFNGGVFVRSHPRTTFVDPSRKAGLTLGGALWCTSRPGFGERGDTKRPALSSDRA